MTNNVGEPTVDEVFQRVNSTASAKMDTLASAAATIANSGAGTIKNNDGKKSGKY